MHWEFSIGWFFAGIVAAVIGVLMVKFYKPISDNWVHGLSSYDKVKLAGIIAIIVGFVFMSNLHSTILYLIFHLIAPSKFP